MQLIAILPTLLSTSYQTPIITPPTYQPLYHPTISPYHITPASYQTPYHPIKPHHPYHPIKPTITLSKTAYRTGQPLACDVIRCWMSEGMEPCWP